MPKLKILSASEQKEFDLPPVLSGEERRSYFRLSRSLSQMLDDSTKKDNYHHRIGFVLMFYVYPWEWDNTLAFRQTLQYNIIIKSIFCYYVLSQGQSFNIRFKISYNMVYQV